MLGGSQLRLQADCRGQRIRVWTPETSGSNTDLRTLLERHDLARKSINRVELIDYSTAKFAKELRGIVIGFDKEVEFVGAVVIGQLATREIHCVAGVYKCVRNIG